MQQDYQERKPSPPLAGEDRGQGKPLAFGSSALPASGASRPLLPQAGEGDGLALSFRHVKAVIFDWAGTVVDYGSLAPMGAFVETFEQFGVSITIDEARGPMGMAKRPHIAALMALPRVAQAWADKYGHAPGEADIDAVDD